MVEINEKSGPLEKTVVLQTNKLLVVVGIPAFNEEKTIARVVLEAQKYAPMVVVCDDGSTDLTAEIAERMGALVVRHEENSGYGAALKSLFKQARELNADILVTVDGDGQHDPSEIPRLVKPIEDRTAEVVLGSRFKDAQGTSEMPIYRRLGVKAITKLVNGSGKNNVSDAQSGFRSYSRRALEYLSLCDNGMSASVELLRNIRRSGLKLSEVPISCRYGSTVGVKTSSENAVSHGLGLIASIVRLVVEERPLALVGIPGIVSVTMGVVFGIVMMNIYVNSHLIPTNVALASIAFILIGFFMISTAITLYAIARMTNKIQEKSSLKNQRKT